MGVLIPSCIGVAVEGTGDTVNKWIKCRKLSESVYISGTRATLDSKEQTSNIPHRSHIWMQWSSWRMHGCFTSHTISRCITGKTETVRNLKLSSIHTHTHAQNKKQKQHSCIPVWGCNSHIIRNLIPINCTYESSHHPIRKLDNQRQNTNFLKPNKTCL